MLVPLPTVVGPVRLAAIRAAVLVGTTGAVLVEALSTVHALTRAVLLPVWLGIVADTAVAAYRRYRRDGALPRWPKLGLNRADRVLAGVVVALLLAELIVALVSPPNNYDSQTYHLPKIEHWVVQRDVQFFPTRIHRQLTMAPGAEYLLLHLRLLTGGNLLYNLLQWSAGVLCVLAASRVAGQLGGHRRAQLVTAFVVGTAPIVTLEASSTQTDLVVAAWVVSVATLVLDELHRRTPWAAAALLGAGAGLTALTKATGLLGAGPLLLLWAVSQLRRAPLRALASGALVVAVAVVIAGPYLYRVDQTFGNPLGPDYLRSSVSMQRHDPAAILVNALHIGHTALDTPITSLDNAAAHAIDRLSRGLGVNPDDRRIVFPDSTFPTVSWPPDEDRASFPLQGILVLVGAVVLLVRGTRLVRGYTGMVVLAAILYAALVKWQPWGNRLVIFLLVLGAPLAGLWLGSVLTPGPGRVRRVGAWVAAAALVVGAGAGGLAVGYGWPRRLVGSGSVFTESRTQQLFNRRPKWLGDYEAAADALRAAGVRRVGLVQGDDTWEYPWWVLLPGVDIEALQSIVPDHPAVVRPQDLDAVVCVADQSTCAYHVPTGWTLVMHGTVGYALPPG